MVAQCIYALTGAIIYDALYTALSELSVVEMQARKIYSNDGFSVTKQAMFCQSTLNPSSLKENNAIPFLLLGE